ncbi:unnamed protein product [Linum tenue]|uniref:Glutaredoxin domain-containing protein n=1 Tax=Linum tenue TaxID=586396 RepID=A0AAV0K6E7_9ROSI|nr:unnamed protein product [Linum tenue]
MKGMKGKLAKKLKSIKPVVYLKQPGRILQPISGDEFRSVSENQWVEPPNQTLPTIKEDIDKDGMELDDSGDDDFVEDKENFGRPPVKALFPGGELEETSGGSVKLMPLSEIDISSFRPPDLNSSTLFDPNLLAAFKMAVKEFMQRIEEERRVRIASREDCVKEQASSLKQSIIEEEIEEEGGNPLLNFEERCPPGGIDRVIFYSTTLRGIRKTFEDCNGVRFLLQSLRVRYHERDVSMHKEYREELWEVLEGKVMPPRLFVKGRYIGGAEEVLGLNEQGKFRVLFEGLPPVDSSTEPCEACNGVCFVLCFNCSGSHRISTPDGLWSECLYCNENGLIICSHCCC